MPDAQSSMSPHVARVLDDLVALACGALGEDLSAVVLFGSAAEGRMRATSDVNLILVLRALTRDRLDRLRAPLAAAEAAILLRPMFLLESEIEAAASAFAVKFADILHRRHILWGNDPFAALTVSRAALLSRLRQVLLNASLHLRESYLLRGLRGEQLLELIAESAGPLRTAAAAMLDLEGRPAPSPKDALIQVAAELPGKSCKELLDHVSEVRQREPLEADLVAETVWGLIELADRMRERVAQIA